MRNILGIYSAPRPHWVGDGFPVRSMLSHFEQGEHVSPFIMLDYAGPARFEPTAKRSSWTPSSGSVAWTVAVATERAGISRSVSCDRGTFTPVLVASSSW